MADILIRGMEMPQENEILVFDEWHGKIYARSTANLGTKRYEVVPLPEGHGRLGDLDRLESFLRTLALYQSGERQQGILGCCETIKATPTIVPAEGGGKDGDE